MSSDSVSVQHVKPATRSIQLDLLRCFAVLATIGAHIGILPSSKSCFSHVITFWHSYGWFGVPLFFVLSGFLVSGLLFREFDRSGTISVTRFLIRRGLKIYPVYFLFLGYILFMLVFRCYYANMSFGDTVSKYLHSYWPNFLFIQNYIGLNPAGHTWSIAVEEHFYVLLPFTLLYLCRRCNMRVLGWAFCLAPLVFTIIRAVAFLLGSSYITNTDRTMAASHLVFDGLLLGVGLRAVSIYSPLAFERLRNYRAILFLTGVALFGVGISLSYPISRIVYVYPIAAAAIFLSVYLTRASDFGVFGSIVRKASLPFAYIGSNSYSIYIWHVTILGIFTKPVAKFCFGATSDVFWALAMSIVLTIVLLGGSAIAVFIEWPILKFRDRMFPSKTSL